MSTEEVTMGLDLHLLKFARDRVKAAEMPPAAPPPPTNGAPVPPPTAPPAPYNTAPMGQIPQASPPVTTSQGASVPAPVTGAMQRAPQLMQSPGGSGK